MKNIIIIKFNWLCLMAIDKSPFLFEYFPENELCNEMKTKFLVKNLLN